MYPAQRLTSPLLDVSLGEKNSSQEREGFKKLFMILPLFRSVCSSFSLSSPALYPSYWKIVIKLSAATLTATLLTTFVPQIHFLVIFSPSTVLWNLWATTQLPLTLPDTQEDSMHFSPEIQLGTFMRLAIIRLPYMLLESHTFHRILGNLSTYKS